MASLRGPPLNGGRQEDEEIVRIKTMEVVHVGRSSQKFLLGLKFVPKVVNDALGNLHASMVFLFVDQKFTALKNRLAEIHQQET